MRRVTGIAVVAVCVLVSALSLLPRETEKSDRPRFEPVEVVSIVEPIYPPNTIAVGTVVLEVIIEESGEIEHVRRVQGPSPLAEESERTVRKWTFKPARLDGKPIRASAILTFTFRPCPVNIAPMG